MKKKLRPTDAELEILQVLWDNGPCSVRFVNDELSQRKDVGYTTTLKLMQIMVDKGIADRDTSSRRHLYEAAIPRDEAQNRLLKKLADLAFGGSAVRLAMQALGDEQASRSEIDQLRLLLDQLEENAANGK
mgnify:CR=1 FL=1